MAIDITNKEEKQIALTGAEIEETLVQAHLSKAALEKIEGLESTASRIDNVVNTLLDNGVVSSAPSSKNMFDKSVFIKGYLNINGDLISHEISKISDYIAVLPNTNYSYQNFYGQSTKFCEYDLNKILISALPLNNPSASANGTFKTSSNTAFVRFSIRDVNNFMLELGLVNSPYEGYNLVSSPSVLFPFVDLNGVAFGDSITDNLEGWIPTFIQKSKVKSLLNYAISGQKIAWRVGTVETVNPPSDGNDNNVFWNSIKKWENESSVVPDFIIIALGTNDISQGSPKGTYAEAFAQSEASTDNMTMANAFRKCLQYLITNYPNTQLFYSTPVQSLVGGRNYATISNVRDILVSICNRFGVVIIDTCFESGITSEIETLTGVGGRYLYDGVHPNSLGREKMGNYIFNRWSKSFIV